MAYKKRKKKQMTILGKILYPQEALKEAFEEDGKTKKGKYKTIYRITPPEERMLKGIAEQGYWYPAKRGFSYTMLITRGYIVRDQYERPYITEEGKRYLKAFNIKWKKQPAPKFKEPSYKEESKEIEKASGEFPEVKEIKREEKTKPTAERLVEEA